MKSLKQIIELIEENKSRLKKKYNIRSIGIFGSYSRGQSTGRSDIDILVEFNEPIGLAFVDLADELEEILGIKVDLVSKNGIKPKYLQRIEEDLVNV